MAAGRRRDRQALPAQNAGIAFKPGVAPRRRERFATDGWTAIVERCRGCDPNFIRLVMAVSPPAFAPRGVRSRRNATYERSTPSFNPKNTHLFSHLR